MPIQKMLKSSIDYLRLWYISVPDIGVGSEFEVWPCCAAKCSGKKILNNFAALCAEANFSKCATLGCKIKPFIKGMQYST